MSFLVLTRLFRVVGMTILALDSHFQKETVFPAFPDMFGMTDAEIGEIPPYVQYFKCNNKLEEGDPGCGDRRFNMTICPERDGR